MSGTHVEVTRTGAGHLTRFAAVDTLVLRDGAQVVLRVLAAPQGGGQGLVALAGRRLAAELPAGLVPGQRLTVTVEGQDGGRVLLRILGERGAGATTDTAAKLAGRLAVSGDAELLRVALALAGNALPLPDRGAAELELDPDDGVGGERDEVRVARVVVHSPELGPVEIVLTLTNAGIAASVEAEPGRAATLAAEAHGELATALCAAAGRPAMVSVRPRPVEAGRPVPPFPLDWLDVRA